MSRKVVLACAVAVVMLSGCGRESRRQDYRTLTGVVTERRADTGELSVSFKAAGEREPSIVSCLMTRDSEVYINDRLGSIEDVRIGDILAIIGYYEPDPEPARFVISYGRIRRPSSSSSSPPAFIAAVLGVEDNKRDE